VNAARALGWGRCVHFSENGMEVSEGVVIKLVESGGEREDGVVVISHLEELRTVWSDIFKYV
jgi:pyrimidine and pyridine-specific 5'-nucleotidase